MSNRLKLHNLLLSIGGPNVYYQTPSDMVLKYPCIKYNRDKIDNKHADDSVYMQNEMYTITVIDKNCDSEIVNQLSKLIKCTFDRSYVSDNLNHTVFNLYY